MELLSALASLWATCAQHLMKPLLSGAPQLVLQTASLAPPPCRLVAVDSSPTALAWQFQWATAAQRFLETKR